MLKTARLKAPSAAPTPGGCGISPKPTGSPTQWQRQNRVIVLTAGSSEDRQSGAAPTDSGEPAGVGVGMGVAAAVAVAEAPTDDDDPAGVGVGVDVGVAATVGAAVAPGGDGKLGGSGGGEYPSTGMNVPYSTLTLAAERQPLWAATPHSQRAGGAQPGWCQHPPQPQRQPGMPLGPQLWPLLPEG